MTWKAIEISRIVSSQMQALRYIMGKVSHSRMERNASTAVISGKESNKFQISTNNMEPTLGIADFIWHGYLWTFNCRPLGWCQMHSLKSSQLSDLYYQNGAKCRRCIIVAAWKAISLHITAARMEPIAGNRVSATADAVSLYISCDRFLRVK